MRSRARVLLPVVLALAAAPSTLVSCSWERPGHAAFMGDVVAAVDHYRDIPAAVRDALKRRMSAGLQTTHRAST